LGALEDGVQGRPRQFDPCTAWCRPQSASRAAGRSKSVIDGESRHLKRGRPLAAHQHCLESPRKVNIMKIILACCASLMAACCAMSASAALVTLNGSCGDECSDIGLSTGDAVSAWFDVNTSGVTGLTLGKADVTAFSIDLGNIAFGNNDLSNWDFWLVTDQTGVVTGFQFLASFGTSYTNLGDSVDLRLPWWAAAHQATCFNGIDATACDFSVGGNAFVYAPPQISGNNPVVTISQDVPEPASLALAGAALLGLCASSRRRGHPRAVAARLMAA
jgi:hypothetical protein